MPASLTSSRRTPSCFAPACQAQAPQSCRGAADKKKTADDNDNDIIFLVHHTAGPYPPACRTTHRQKDNRIVTSLVPDRFVHKMDSIILCSRVHFYFWSLCLFFFGSVQLTFCSGRAVEKFLWRSVLVSTRHYQNRKKAP